MFCVASSSSGSWGRAGDTHLVCCFVTIQSQSLSQRLGDTKLITICLYMPLAFSMEVATATDNQSFHALSIARSIACMS